MNRLFILTIAFFTAILTSNGQNISSTNITSGNTQEKMIMIPSFAQLPLENQEIENEELEMNHAVENKYSVKRDYMDDVNVKAGLLLEKGGNQLVAGTVLPLIFGGLGALLIYSAASSASAPASTSYGGSTSTTSSSDSGFAMVGAVVVLGGIAGGIILNISGANNIRKAGKILRTQTL